MKVIFKGRVKGFYPDSIKELINNMINQIKNWNSIKEDEEYEFRLILNELIANAVTHGNEMLCSKELIAIIQEVDRETISIIIRDEGKGFNYKDIIMGKFPCDNFAFSERGRGLKLIKAICDDVQFNKCGNQIKVCKSIKKKTYV